MENLQFMIMITTFFMIDGMKRYDKTKIIKLMFLYTSFLSAIIVVSNYIQSGNYTTFNIGAGITLLLGILILTAFLNIPTAILSVAKNRK